MQRLLLAIFLFLSLSKAFSQVVPNVLPTYLSNQYYAFQGYSSTDSSSRFAIRDTNFIPNSPGWSVYWRNPGVDTTLWIYNGVKWTKFANSSEGSAFSNGIKYFPTLSSFTSYVPQLNEVSILDDSVYGGGIFVAIPKGSITVDSGFYFPNASTLYLWGRKVVDPNTVKMEWYNVKLGYTGNTEYYVQKAIKYLAARKGGYIKYGAGVYLDSPYLHIDSNNIHIQGSGIGTTTINADPASGAGLVVNTRYRDAGWKLLPAQMLTYNDANITKGKGYIDLKVVGSSDSLKAGMVIFINAGSNYFDQNYGEFNIVDSIIGTRVYLRYNLLRDYTQPNSSWGATSTAIFTPPAEGSSATIAFSGVNGITLPAGYVVSIGNDLYSVVSSTTSSAVVINIPNKGNSTSPIPSGTHIYKYRAIVVTPSTTINSSVENMTINGWRKSLIVSNTFKTYFNNVRFNYNLVSPYTGGIVIDGDDGRDFRAENCIFHAPVLSNTQFARSFADIKFDKCTFEQTALQFSEFNSNISVTNSNINTKYSALANEQNISSIIAGTTCNNVRIEDNIISASGQQSIFSTGEIQGYQATGGTNFYAIHNIISGDSVVYGFTGSAFSNVQILNNTITGRINLLYNIRADTFFTSNNAFSASGRFGWGSKALVQNNTAVGYFDGFGIPAANIEYLNNTTNRLGQGTNPNEYNTWGNVFYTHSNIDSFPLDFKFNDNIFYGRNLVTNSINLIGFPVGKRVEICNDKFIKIVGTYSSIVDSVVSLQCPGETNVPFPDLYIGTNLPNPTYSSGATYNPNTNSFYIQGNMLFENLAGSGQFTLHDIGMYSYSVNSNASWTIAKPVFANYQRKSLWDVNNQLLQFQNGNTDATGFKMVRGQGIGISNYANETFTTGSTQDNNGSYRQGYNIWQLGNSTGGIYTHSQQDSTGFHLYTGVYTAPLTITPIGTNGNQTINTAMGTVNIAAAGTSVTIANSLITANSDVKAYVATNDANKTRVYAVTNSTGTATIYVDPAPAAAIVIKFTVTNQ